MVCLRLCGVVYLAGCEGAQELGAMGLLILFAATVPASLQTGLTLIEAILRVAQFFLAAAALFLIFTGNAHPWFDRGVTQPKSYRL